MSESKCPSLCIYAAFYLAMGIHMHIYYMERNLFNRCPLNLTSHINWMRSVSKINQKPPKNIWLNDLSKVSFNNVIKVYPNKISLKTIHGKTALCTIINYVLVLFMESALTKYYNFNHSNTLLKNVSIFEKYAYHIWMEQLSLRLAFRFLHTIIVREGLVRPQVEHWLIGARRLAGPRLGISWPCVLVYFVLYIFYHYRELILPSLFIYSYYSMRYDLKV